MAAIWRSTVHLAAKKVLNKKFAIAAVGVFVTTSTQPNGVICPRLRVR